MPSKLVSQRPLSVPSEPHTGLVRKHVKAVQVQNRCQASAELGMAAVAGGSGFSGAAHVRADNVFRGRVEK